ncbi:hypothetical protein LENED_004418 [Lentinula edodes]|uniref:Uncharacterized protein n=1 Tax=Lentinula edodes TaxID=5353 RepID=A0A1Q3E6F4_LENED|nr:hypothetical protein LENED_004418 [Lentinula edodes]
MLKLLSSSKICTSGALVAHLYSGIVLLSLSSTVNSADDTEEYGLTGQQSFIQEGNQGRMYGCRWDPTIRQIMIETGMLRAYARTHHNRRSLCWLSRLDCSQSTGEPIVKDTL